MSTAQPPHTELTTQGEGAEEPITIAVLYGGQSTEHSVSCITAGAIMDHLDPQRYTIVPIGITRAGAWVAGTTDTTTLRAHGDSLPSVTDTGEHLQLTLGGTPGELRYATGSRAGETHATVDLIFPVLHGVNGEDGTVQGLCELAGVPYVGNGVLASAAGMDKSMTKLIARTAGVPVAPEVLLTQPRELTAAERDTLGLPLFVKPVRGGSSFGVSKVTSWDNLPAALELAFQHDTTVLLEPMMRGPEVECGVLQHPTGELQTSHPAMLRNTDSGADGFYSFDAKYIDNNVTADIPAPLDPAVTAQVQELSTRTFTALGCRGLARVDFFITETGPVLNEVNTLPGFTPISMYPTMFVASGVAYTELLHTLIAEALQRPRIAANPPASDH